MKFRESPNYKYLEAEMKRIPGAGYLPQHLASARGFLAGIPESKGGYAYAPGKWTVAQVIGHFTDAQLVFLNRALFFARGENAALPGFDEDMWVAGAGHGGLGIGAVRDLYAKTSSLTEAVVSSLPSGALAREGVANGLVVTVEEILHYMMAHEMHHLDVIRDRYLA